MDERSDRAGLDRRGLLRGLGTGAGVAAVVVPAVLGPALAGPAMAAESQDERSKARYQPDGQDVQNFYRTNRY